uniref:Uncharacterized protein n=1 Tax=Clytia hemisphaerica TaxID=252671 RepID=A0A7M5V890_9CNID
MDINLLKEIKADRKHNRWQPLCDEARQNLITERRKDKKLEFKCLSPVTDTERIFDKNKDHQNLENVHQSLKKLANVYLCLHRYAINLINKRKEGNLAVIKIIKMYTGYWVSNFTTMEEIAIDNLHYLGYKPNGDQLILDTEEKPSYEAKTPYSIDSFNVKRRLVLLKWMVIKCYQMVKDPFTFTNNTPTVDNKIFITCLHLFR